MGFAGSSSPSQPTICVLGSPHTRTCCARDNTFSVVMAFSRSRASLLLCIDGACEGAAVLTAVSGGESHNLSFLGSEGSGPFEISGSSKATIFSENKYNSTKQIDGETDESKKLTKKEKQIRKQ